MDCRTNYHFMPNLNIIDWSGNNLNLSTFLDQTSSSLPQIVRVVEGFCGTSSSCTIDSEQHLILHALHKETQILAKDSKGNDLFIPKSFQVKVEMVPRDSCEEYSTIKDVLRTFPNYFRILEDIPSLNVTSGIIFQVIRQSSFDNFIECLRVGFEQHEAKTKFPLDLQGRFQPLKDSREFFIDEVLMEDTLPATVHFVKSATTCSNGTSKVFLEELGNVRLIGECETESVFATVLNTRGKSLAVFPKNLDITVKRATVNATYQQLRDEIVKNQEKFLKRLQRQNKLGLYQAQNPIRQFPLMDFLPPVVAKLRTQSLREENSPYLTKERSSSTPADPKAMKPQQSATMKNPPKNGIKKQPLKGSCSINIPHNLPKTSNKKHPVYDPPPIPIKTSKGPILGLKDQDTKDKKTQNTLDAPQAFQTTPKPPPRRKRMTQKKTNEIHDDIDDDEGYVMMSPGDGATSRDGYELMKPTFLAQTPPKNESCSKTLEDMFENIDESDCKEREYENFMPIEKGCLTRKDFNHNIKDGHDYTNMKGLHLARVCDGMESLVNISVVDEDDKNFQGYENMKPINMKNLQADIAEHLSKNEETKEMHPSYENTAFLNHEASSKGMLDYCHQDVNTLIPDYENTKKLELKQGKNNDTKRNGLYSNSFKNDQEGPCYENSSILNVIPTNDKQCSESLTMTDQLINKMRFQRPSPIGMDNSLIYDDENDYTRMDGNYQSFEEDTYYESKQDYYVDMSDDKMQTEVNCNEPTNCSEKRESCYEEISIPHRRKEGDGSSKDFDPDDLHYQQVDLSALALPCPEESPQDDLVYEVVDNQENVVKEKQQRKTQRRPPPPRPSRHERKAFKSEVDTKNPKSPQKVSKSLDDRKLQLPKSKHINSQELGVFNGDSQLQMAMLESLKDAKKASFTRPPAPPPKKVNYVQVETGSSPLLITKPRSKTAPTNYCDILAMDNLKTDRKDNDLTDQENSVFREQKKSSTPNQCDAANMVKTVAPNLSEIKKSFETPSKDANKPLKPPVPRKLTVNASSQSNIEKPSEQSLSTSPSTRKRALLPPPKPKRTFANSEQNSNKQSPNEVNKECPPMEIPPNKVEKVKARPRPLPRKKL